MMEKKERVMIFCDGKHQISAAIALAYLMKTRNWHLRQSFLYLYDLQPSLRPAVGFIRYLSEMESMLFPALSSASFPMKCYILFYNQQEDLERNLAYVVSNNENKITVEEQCVDAQIDAINNNAPLDESVQLINSSQ